MGIYPGYAEYMTPSRHIRRLTIYQPSSLDRDRPDGPCLVNFTVEFHSPKSAQAFRSELYEFSRFWEPTQSAEQVDDPPREYAQAVAQEIMESVGINGLPELRRVIEEVVMRHVQHGNDVVDRIAEMGGVHITNRAVVTTEPPGQKDPERIWHGPNWIWRGPDETEFHHYRHGEARHPVSQCSIGFCGMERNQEPWATG